METRGWLLPSDAEMPVRPSTLSAYLQANGGEVDFTTIDLLDFNLFVFFDNGATGKNSPLNERAKDLVQFDVLGDLFFVAEDSEGVVALSKDRFLQCLL